MEEILFITVCHGANLPVSVAMVTSQQPYFLYRQIALKPPLYKQFSNYILMKENEIA